MKLVWKKTRTGWESATQRFVNPLTIQTSRSHGEYYILSGGGLFAGTAVVIASGKGKLADAKRHAQRLEDGTE